MMIDEKSLQKDSTEGRTFNIAVAADAQARYCVEARSPLFAPGKGTCWNCGKNIYKAHRHVTRDGREYTTGYAVQEAEGRLITGCPHCHKSFVD